MHDSVPVYNLSVADGFQHEFYANGILVHNCDWNPKDETQDSPDRMDALVWALTELADGTDSFLEFVKGQAQDMAKAGVIQAEKPVLNVDGSNHSQCECGCTVWVKLMNREACFKCGKDRPE